MKLLLATHNYPRFAGDAAGVYLQRLAAWLAGEGHSVRVVSPHAPGSREREVDPNLEVERFRYAPARLECVGYRGEASPGRLLRSPAALIVPVYV